MERNSPDSQGYRLESQIREAYGKTVYTKVCHDKNNVRLLKLNNKIKVWQVILSSVTTGSLVFTLIADIKVAGIMGSLLSLSLLMLNAFVKNFDIMDNSAKHQKASNQLWKIGEEYISLLTDFEVLEPGDIMKKRDDLLKRTAEVNNDSPRIDAKSCRQAKKEFKKFEGQTSFSDKEIDAMLPLSIRRRNRDMSDNKGESKEVKKSPLVE